MRPEVGSTEKQAHEKMKMGEEREGKEDTLVDISLGSNLLGSNQRAVHGVLTELSAKLVYEDAS